MSFVTFLFLLRKNLFKINLKLLSVVDFTDKNLLANLDVLKRGPRLLKDSLNPLLEFTLIIRIGKIGLFLGA